MHPMDKFPIDETAFSLMKSYTFPYGAKFTHSTYCVGHILQVSSELFEVKID